MPIEFLGISFLKKDRTNTHTHAHRRVCIKNECTRRRGVRKTQAVNSSKKKRAASDCSIRGIPLSGHSLNA